MSINSKIMRQPVIPKFNYVVTVRGVLLSGMTLRLNLFSIELHMS